MQPTVRVTQPTPEEFRDRFLHYLRYSCGIEMQFARAADHLEALALARARVDHRPHHPHRATYDEVRPKVVNYLSLEYLLGRLMRNNLIATGLLDTAREAMQLIGLTWTRSSMRSTTPVSAPAASAGSPPASWTRWRPSTTGLRLRSALRLRHVPTGFRRRMAGGARRRLARRGQRLGVERPTSQCGDDRRSHRVGPRRVRRPSPAVGRLADLLWRAYDMRWPGTTR